MGKEDTYSGGFRNYTKPITKSSDTAIDEFEAIGEGTNQVLLLTTLAEELSGHSPGLLNTDPQTSPFQATMLYTNSSISDAFMKIDVNTTPRSIALTLGPNIRTTPIYSDSKVVTEVIRSQGKIHHAKRLRHASRLLNKCMVAQEVKIIDLQHVSS